MTVIIQADEALLTIAETPRGQAAAREAAAHQPAAVGEAEGHQPRQQNRRLYIKNSTKLQYINTIRKYSTLKHQPAVAAAKLCLEISAQAEELTWS